MRKLILLFIYLILLPAIMAQGNDSQKDHYQKIEDLKAVKLLEILETDENTGIQAVAKMKEYNREVGHLYYQKDSLIWNCKENLPANEKEAKNRLTKILSLESIIAKKRAEYLASLKQILTEAEILKYLLFEKEFLRELREMMKRKRENKN